MRNYVRRSTDPDMQYREVTGYLLVGDLVRNNWEVDERREILANSHIYVRRYGDLLSMVKKNHADFLKRYEELRKAKGGR